jgi:hypothetical protein
MKSFLIFLFLFLFLLPLFVHIQVASALPLIAEEVPFWKAKSKVYKKILEERAVMVAVKTIDDSSVKATPKIMQMLGGGIIHVPQKFAFETAKDFKKLEKVSSHIRQATWIPKTETLYLHTEAFNYHAQMNLKVKFIEGVEKSTIQWTHVSGVFTGMEGRIEFATLLPAKGATATERSEIALATGYRYNKFPIPALFLEFGLEVIMQKIAGRMRSFIEEEYKRCHKGSGVCNESKPSS